MAIDEHEIYELHKKRETVGKMFDTYKTVLNVDKIYLQDDESVFGPVFLSLLSLYLHCTREQLLKKAELNRKLTPIDLLFKYSTVYHAVRRDLSMIPEVPKNVKDREERFGLNIYVLHYTHSKYSWRT